MPKLLQLQTAANLEASRDKDVNVLLILDKQLRSSGTAAKLPAVFSFYEVRRSMQNSCTYITSLGEIDTIIRDHSS